MFAGAERIDGSLAELPWRDCGGNISGGSVLDASRYGFIGIVESDVAGRGCSTLYIAVGPGERPSVSSLITRELGAPTVGETGDILSCVCRDVP